IYPLIDRPDWEEPERWHNSGLWDVVSHPDGTLHRVLCEPYAQDLRAAQSITEPTFLFNHYQTRAF
ncbi:MAG TPA: hypothetical protein VGO27_14415, partial [Candidatus Acidoferrum sp.]|nr:hypothetical protein [Candidatus Acidoferrum sp.]